MESPRTSLRSTLATGAAAALATVAATVPFLGRYGWDRDELYFRSAAHHLALGYVDFPPLVAWLGWAVERVAPDSLVTLRAVCLALGAVSTVLVALMARELGGGIRAQAIAALAWGTTPYLLGSASIFHPTWLDELGWVAILYVATRILVRGERGLWPVLGVVAGLALEAKYTVAVLLALLALALALTDRRAFTRRGPWLAIAIAALLLAPNLAWQAWHGWPSFAFAGSQNAKTASDTPPLTYVAEVAIFLGGTLLLAGAGIRLLWRRNAVRALALVPIGAFVFFLLARGRAYYPLPAASVAVAAGAVAIERRRVLPLAALALQVATLVVAAPVVLPVRSTGAMIRSGVWKDSFYKDEIGWPELAGQVERAWQSLSPAERRNGVVLAGNYGEASALDYYARDLPVLSGHLSWQYWRPRRLPQRFALLVGIGEPRKLCRSTRVLATIENRYRLDNEERGRTIVACRLRRPLGELWHRDVVRTSL